MRSTAPSNAARAPDPMTTGVVTLKLAMPRRLISIASHASVEIRPLQSSGPSHGAQKPRKTMPIWIHIRRRNSMALAFMTFSRWRRPYPARAAHLKSTQSGPGWRSAAAVLFELLDFGSVGNLHLELVIRDGHILLHVIYGEHQLDSLLRALDGDL